MSGRARFAPAAVLRAAAWPAEQLAALGAGGGDAEQRLARDREIVWRQAHQRDFLKALTVANPTFAARVAATVDGAKAPRRKRQRHLETTLYRYWARAVGRPTPGDLWAGMTVAAMGSTTDLQHTAPHRVFLPDLGVLRSMLRALAATPARRRCQAYRLNATLHEHSPERFSYCTRAASGGAEMRQLDCKGAMRAVLQSLPVDTASHAEIAARVASVVGDESDAAAMVDALVEAGVLVGGLDLPARFETVWQALERVELSGDEGEAWQRAVEALHGCCERLSRDYEQASPAEVAEALQRAREVVIGLREQLGCAPCEIPQRVLRCDLRLPVAARLGADVLGPLEQHLEAYRAAFLERGPLADYRRRWRQRLGDFAEREGGALAAAPRCRALQVMGDSPARSWEELLAGVGETLQPQWARWLAGHSEDGLAPSTGDTADAAQRWPLGALVLALSSERPAIIGATLDVASAFARHALTDDIAGLSSWLAGALRARDDTVVELVGDLSAHNANALARPELGLHAVTLWSAEADAASLHGARMRLDAHDRARLELADGRLVSAASFSSANLAGGDPFAALALASSGRVSAAWRLPAAAFPVQQELERPRFADELRSPSGAQLRPRRTVLAGEALVALQQARGFSRFERWQTLADELGWPRELDVARGGGEPLRVVRDSPLAVEALFEGFSQPGALLVVSEARPPWLELAAGSVVAEVVAPFSCDLAHTTET